MESARRSILSEFELLRKICFYIKINWSMARRRTEKYRPKVDAATRCSGVCPHI